MFSRLVRYYRARKMRWAVRRLKIAGPGERRWIARHRAHRRGHALRRITRRREMLSVRDVRLNP